MTVAQGQVAMRWSELVIMYLAAAAPFGVARLLSSERFVTRRALALSVASAALLWPRSIISLIRRGVRVEGSVPRACGGPEERRVEQVERAAVGALLSVEDILEGECGPLDGAERHAMYAARSCVSRYAGLALACAEMTEAEPGPTTRETELFRVAGRKGEDLLTAGRCVRRRNAALLTAHRERARDELVHSLAAAGEAAHKALSAGRSGDAEAAGVDGLPARVSEALLGAYARTVELLSLFDERTAVVSAARLMDAECARLRRLETHAVGEAAPRGATQEGAERCTTPTAHGAFATTLRSTTT